MERSQSPLGVSKCTVTSFPCRTSPSERAEHSHGTAVKRERLVLGEATLPESAQANDRMTERLERTGTALLFSLGKSGFMIGLSRL